MPFSGWPFPRLNQFRICWIAVCFYKLLKVQKVTLGEADICGFSTQDDMKHRADRATFFRRSKAVNLIQEVIGKNLPMDELRGAICAEAKNVACAVDPARSRTRH